MPIAEVICPWCAKMVQVNVPAIATGGSRRKDKSCTPCKHCQKDIVVIVWKDGSWKIRRSWA